MIPLLVQCTWHSFTGRYLSISCGIDAQVLPPGNFSGGMEPSLAFKNYNGVLFVISISWVCLRYMWVPCVVFCPRFIYTVYWNVWTSLLWSGQEPSYHIYKMYCWMLPLFFVIIFAQVLPCILLYITDVHIQWFLLGVLLYELLTPCSATLHLHLPSFLSGIFKGKC